jgi:AcrR family transcriptional regulator
VAEESGVSIGSLYQYFPSKAAIVAALIDQVLEEEYNRVKELLESMSPSVGPREIAKTFFFQYFRIEGEDLALRKTLVEAVPNVERAENAIKFHQRMAEALISYFQTHFNVRKEDLRTEAFLLQYLSKGIVLASIDDQMKELDRDRLSTELADTFLRLFKISDESRNFTN